MERPILLFAASAGILPRIVSGFQVVTRGQGAGLAEPRRRNGVTAARKVRATDPTERFRRARKTPNTTGPVTGVVAHAVDGLPDERD